jgi:hypothetical protein
MLLVSGFPTHFWVAMKNIKIIKYFYIFNYSLKIKNNNFKKKKFYKIIEYYKFITL